MQVVTERLRGVARLDVATAAPTERYGEGSDDVRGYLVEHQGDRQDVLIGNETGVRDQDPAVSS